MLRMLANVEAYVLRAFSVFPNRRDPREMFKRSIFGDFTLYTKKKQRNVPATTSRYLRMYIYVG